MEDYSHMSLLTLQMHGLEKNLHDADGCVRCKSTRRAHEVVGVS